MTEVAALQMNVDTSSVLRAANDLDRFSASAARAGATSGNHAGSISKLVASVSSMDDKLSKIISLMEKMGRATKETAAANDNLAKSFAVADAHVIAYTQHLAALNAQQKQADAHVIAYQQSLAKQASATQQSDAHIMAFRNSLVKVEDGAKKASTAIKFTAQDSLNASRQMADIGVTAAMGMSPFMIAIQQGPQLLDILQNKAAQTGQTLGTVFRAATVAVLGLLAPLAPVIAALGVAAAAIAAVTAQANDDSGLKKYTTAMGYTAEEVKKLNAITVTWGDTAKAVFQVGWKRIADYFGLSTSDLSKKWKDFTDWLVTAIRAAVAGVYAALTGMQNVIPRIIDNIKSGKKENLFEIVGGSFKDQYKEAQTFMDDVVSQAQKNAQGRQSKLAAELKDTPAAKVGGAKDAFSFADLMADADKIERDIRDTAAAVGLYGEALAKVQYEQQLFNQAVDQGLKLSTQERAAITAKAEALAKLSEANRLAQWREDTKQDILDRAEAIKQEASAIGVMGRDLRVLRIEQELLNTARSQNIAVNDNDRQKISDSAAILAEREYQNIIKQAEADRNYSHNVRMRSLDEETRGLYLVGEAASTYALYLEEVNRQRALGIADADIDTDKIYKQARAYSEASKALQGQKQYMSDAREVMGGFFTGLVDGLRNGGNAFKVFADSVLNSLNRIVDKMLDKALDGLFGGGGFGSLFGGGLGRLTGSVNATVAANPSIFAKGGTFGTPTRFANGGTFTNSIVSSPTLFRFANGGALGEMGEAGPEAIMPLKRGANGSLGVQMHGGDSRLHVSVSVDGNGELKAFVRNEAGGIVAQSAPIIADAGSRQAQSKISHRNTRRVA